MRRVILILLFGISGCAIQHGSLSEEIERVRLDFRNCIPDLSYSFIDIKVPTGHKLFKTGERGFCEYMMTFPDKSVLYVSSNIYAGSSLNYLNRLNMNIMTYSTNRSENDTIRNNGVEADGKYWLEWIVGDYVVGYINTIDSAKFNQSLGTIELIDNH